MVKEIIKQCKEHCPECGEKIIQDIVHDEKFCKRCGLVISAPYMHEFEGVDFE